MKEILKHLEYENGWLVWNKSIGNNKKGSIAGTKKGRYQQIRFKGKAYYTHRLIWELFNGEEPEIIDHQNKNKWDNRIENLMNGSKQANNKNHKLNRRNKTGFMGVNWSKVKNKWTVYIGVNNKKKFMGEFIEMNNAIIARKIAEKVFDYHMNHGGAK